MGTPTYTVVPPTPPLVVVPNLFHGGTIIVWQDE
jgi:hypothetical protein